MKNYQVTDEEIRQALTDASMGFIGGFHINGNDGLDPDKWETNHVDMMNAFLDALPEPGQDDWEECGFEDIQKGDRVRMVQAGRTTDFHLPVIETHPTHLVLRDNTQCSNFHKALYYRIPAPVQHPDPMEHHIITCHDRENDYFWNGVTGKYMSLYDPRNLYSREDFTDWSPAKVVADDE